jgi:uncharacterized protein (TIGR00159 family)
MQMSVGLVLLASTFFIARAVDLPALEVISREILFYLPFAVIVLFQHEIRRALARVGANRVFAIFARVPAVEFEPILRAAEMLSARKIGALIAIERTQSLRMLIETAKPVDAVVTAELLVSIFTPGGPLHDGAVIIHANRIVAAGALLPLTPSVDANLPHGTRHRAALGLSEDSDALVIVLSEENGSIAVASEGVLRENLDRNGLLRVMHERLGAER